MHSTVWKTAVVHGVILQDVGSCHKVQVQWEDSINNLQKNSEHGVQTFITDNSQHCKDAVNAENVPPNAQSLLTGVVNVQSSSTPALPQSLAQNQALFSHPASQPRFQPLTLHTAILLLYFNASELARYKHWCAYSRAKCVKLGKCMHSKWEWVKIERGKVRVQRDGTVEPLNACWNACANDTKPDVKKSRSQDC
jgi:hypothetical protein